MRAEGIGELQTKLFEIDGRRLYYHDEGAGRSVLILHGASLTQGAGAWDQVARALVEAGYRAIFPYRAGRGESDPHPIFLSLARDSRDMWALTDELALDRVVLVGHSAGAFVARDMLLKQPHRVAGVVSEDSAAFGKLSSATHKAADTDRFDAEDRALYEKYKETLAFLERPWEYPSEHNVLRILKRRKALHRDNLWKRQQVPHPDDAPVPEGRWCKVPLLLFTAGRGRIRQDDPEADQLRQQIPAEDVQFIVVTKSGHGIHEEQFEIFMRELLAFLERSQRPRRGQGHTSDVQF